MHKQPDSVQFVEPASEIVRLHGLPHLLAERIVAALNDSEIPSFVRVVLLGLLASSATVSPVPLITLQNLIYRSSQILMSDRTIKRAIALLIEKYGIAVGASRTDNHGYFFVRTPEQSQAAIRPLLAEIRSLARRCRILSPRSLYGRAVHGQEAL